MVLLCNAGFDYIVSYIATVATKISSDPQETLTLPAKAEGGTLPKWNNKYKNQNLTTSNASYYLLVPFRYSLCNTFNL